MRNMSQRISSFMKYLQKVLEHDEYFYKTNLNTFIASVSSLSDFCRNKKSLPSS